MAGLSAFVANVTISPIYGAIAGLLMQAFWLQAAIARTIRGEAEDTVN
ncbi:MAG: hypothetical protein KDJ29_15895 [Hyphomicrobiales bacterium]|nr:hypothetical protein [Hyphomicrobiales bacterium]